MQQKWGEPRCGALVNFLENVAYVNIQNQNADLIGAYATIDAYSNRKVADAKGNLLPGSAKAMAKNDLWIAATAYALNVPLMTFDRDFDHLDGTLLKVLKVA